MGKTYKLKPYLVKFIKKQKLNNPALSCRSLSSIINRKFDIKVSKSSINKLFIELGLSQPPGRRAIKIESGSSTILDNMGIILLKAADLSLGLSDYLVSLVTLHLRERNKKQVRLKNDIILFYRLVSNKFIEPKTDIQKSVKFASEGICSSRALYAYLTRLQAVTSLYSDFIDSIPSFLKTISGIKIVGNKGSIFVDSSIKSVIFDGRSSSRDIVTYYKISNYINEEILKKNCPLVILSSNSMNVFQEVVCNFLGSTRIKAINFVDSNGKEVEILPVENNPLNAVIGLFPQDFATEQNIKPITSFKSVEDSLGNIKFIAEGQTTFTQQLVNKRVTLRSIVVRSSVLGMEELILLTNIDQSKMSAEDIFKLFIGQWSNPQDAYYQMNSQKNNLNNQLSKADNILIYNKLGEDSIFDIILEILNYYFQKLFFSPSWKVRGLAFMKENFYSLPGTVKTTSHNQQISLKIKRNHSFLTEIGSACERINQSNLKNQQKRKLQIDLSFK